MPSRAAASLRFDVPRIAFMMAWYSVALTLDSSASSIGSIEDADALCNQYDNCPRTANRPFTDGDSDGPGDACDVCTGGVAVTAAVDELLRTVGIR